MKNILYLCAAKNETAMTKQFSFAILCLLFLAACNKTPEPTPVPEPYNLAGKTYVYQGNHPCDFFMGRQIYELYVFLDESKVVNAKRLDSVNGEVLGINIDTLDYAIEGKWLYTNPNSITSTELEILNEDSIRRHHYVTHASYYEVFERLR